MKTTKIVLGSLLALILTSCEYSNTFTGQYNGAPASLNAYSKNINRYCVALNMTSGTTVTKGYVSAQLLFDANDFLVSKSFNTKGSACNSNMSYYLTGTRAVDVKRTSEVVRTEQMGASLCQIVYYRQYEYQENINFEYRDNTTDQVIGTFNGTGEYETFTDLSRPVRYGGSYYCGPTYPQPYPPYPGPRPNPRPYPRPYPGPRP